MEPAAVATISVLTDDPLRDLLLRLPPADLLRAALACRRWRRLAFLCLPSCPPLLGYFFHPIPTSAPPPIPRARPPHSPAVFLPVDANTSTSPRLSLAFAPGASSSALVDTHLSLLLLLPRPLPTKILPRLLVCDPASHRHELVPPQPRDRWRSVRYFVGAALLSHAHPSRLCFEAVCFTVDDERPRAWVASFSDGECRWRALPRSEEVKIEIVRVRGPPGASTGTSATPPACSRWTLPLEFSFLHAPAELVDHHHKYRVGETPEDGRLCITTVEDGELQLWVRGEARWSNNGWLLEREMNLHHVFDTVPGLPRDSMNRLLCTWLSDIDAGRTGKVFIKTWGYRHYSFHWRPASWSVWRRRMAWSTGTPSTRTSWRGHLPSSLQSSLSLTDFPVIGEDLPSLFMSF